MLKTFALIVVGYLTTSSLVLAADEKDRVMELPNAEPFDSATYSGYLDISDDKSLHYTMVSSNDKPASDPLVIWFNGGPGCSSMLGMFQENGPFVINDGEYQIIRNMNPWNRRANVLYLESPAGVGWSIAKTAEALKTNDYI